MSGFDFDFEIYHLKSEDYRQLIYEEIMLYHDEEAQKKYKADKEANPNGILHLRFGKERLRSKYKDQQ